jgi:hypothetical protein
MSLANIPKIALKPLALIGVYLSVLAVILALILLIQLAWVLPTLTFTTDTVDPNYLTAVYLYTLDHDLYWIFNLIAIGLGLLTSLSGKRCALTFMILMLILIFGALLVRGVYVWLFVMMPGTHRDLLLFAKNILFYGEEYIIAIPIFGLVLAIIMFLFQNKNIKTA